MIVKTSYRNDCAAALTEYISRHRGHEIRDRTGKIMTTEEIDRFVDRSREYNFEREFIISPERQMSKMELDEATRKFMEEWINEKRHSVTYIYAIHEETAHKHVHVAMIGEKRDLMVRSWELERIREQAKEIYRDYPERYMEMEQEQGLGRNELEIER